MGEITFLPSIRGGRLVVQDNFLYRYQKAYKDKTLWKCATFNGCKARISLIDEQFHSISGSHTHEPATFVIKKRKFLAKLVKRVQTEVSTSVANLYKEEVAALSVNGEIPIYLPSYKNIETTLYKARSTMRVTMVPDDDSEPWKRSVYGVSFISSGSTKPTKPKQQPLAVGTCSDSGDEKNACPVKKEPTDEKEKTQMKHQRENLSNIANFPTTPADQQDEFHELGITVAQELRKMHPEQQIFVKNVINRALSFGSLGQLTSESDIYPTDSCLGNL